MGTVDSRTAVREAMGRRKLTLYRLSQESGVPYAPLRKWLAGEQESIRSDSLDALAEALGLRWCTGRKR